MTPVRLRMSPAAVPEGLMTRAIVFVPVAMALWWFLLKPSSLWLLRLLAWLPLGIFVAPPGLEPVRVNADTHEWVFNIEVNTTAKVQRTGQRQRIESVEFAADENNVAFFASGWFCYLALGLSVGNFSRKQARAILTGIGLQTGVSVLMLAAYAYINGYGSVINTPDHADSRVWLLEYIYHIIYLVVPFAGPFVVALLVHPEWRAYFNALSNTPSFRLPQPRVKEGIRRAGRNSNP
jgi:hypothetical protein